MAGDKNKTYNVAVLCNNYSDFIDYIKNQKQWDLLKGKDCIFIPITKKEDMPRGLIHYIDREENSIIFTDWGMDAKCICPKCDGKLTERYKQGDYFYICRVCNPHLFNK